jgi:hypothetical protein
MRIPTRISRAFPIFAVPLAVLALATAGCTAMGPPAPSIEVVNNYQPDDVPVPLNFEYDEQASWGYIKFVDAPLPMRSCELVYWGDRPIVELQSWYRSQMPKHGWNYETTDQLGETRLVFSKGPESAEILLKRTPDENGRYYVTRLIARVGVK